MVRWLNEAEDLEDKASFAAPLTTIPSIEALATIFGLKSKRG